MNVYALFPLIATIAYIPLLASTVSSRPLSKRHTLFILFLIPAMVWSLLDYFFRSNFFPQYTLLIWKATLLSFPVVAVQFHCFTSSFFSPGQGRWLPFAYISLVAMIILTTLGYIGIGVHSEGDKFYPDYGPGVVLIAVPLLILAGRNFYVFGKRLKTLNNPVLYNQTVSLMVGLAVLVVFALIAVLPWGKEYPVSHFGNLINAFILSYAAIRHQLVDIRLVLRQGTALASLLIIGSVSYWLLLIVLHVMFRLELDLAATFVATAVAIVVGIFIYRLRGFFFTVMSRALQGPSYDYRQNLSNFASRIHNIFSLQEQGGELLVLVTKAIGCRHACLLLPEASGEDFATQLIEPEEAENPMSGLKLRGHSPILEYLGRERKPLTRENIVILPEFRGLWARELEEIKSKEIELFMPLISRDRLISIMVLSKKQRGRYSLEDFDLLGDVASRVAVSMEKEYLREQLREREQELSVINRSSAIIASSLDIQGIYDKFIAELKKVVDVSWASIVLVEENSLCVLALSTEIGSAWQVGERIPVKGSGTEWVATYKRPMIEPDLVQESRFATGKYHLRQGVRSLAYLPLIAKGEAIGSLIVASRRPDAYNQRQLALLEQLASQIAMPVENARLYARTEEKSRIDELTTLLNRRSLDEMLASEIGRHSRYGGVFSLAILDLDSFKSFNDNYGHLAGDKLLRQIGSVLKHAIRSADQAFRYGGDEFAILLPQTAVDAASRVSERVRKQVASRANTGHAPVNASLGLASWPADGISANEIMAAADAALYHAKRSGGNQSHCASGTLLPLDDAGAVMVASESGSEADGDLSAIYSLAASVDARDHYTRSHSKKVSEYAVALGEALNLGPMDIGRLETCALLHDIGKIGVSDEILNKRGKLTVGEMEVIKVHPHLGATIISRARQLASCVPAILYHHERYDGGGYPKGLKGEDIPLDARILAVADAFAAMTSERPYAAALSKDSALAELKKHAGAQFDPKLVEAFLSTIKVTALPEEKR